jgi:outer membrane protein assembly factor BamB
MTRLALTDELIRRSLTPPEDGASAGLGALIRDAIEEVPQRRPWWTWLRPIMGPFGPSPALRAIAIIALLALLALAMFIVGSRQPVPTLGDGSMFHGGAARTGEMLGPGPAEPPAVLWEITLDGPLANTMPALAQGNLFVGDGRGHVTIVDTATGSRGWTRELPRPVTSPAIGGDIVVVSAGDGVYGLDPSSGMILWRLATDAAVESSAAIVGSTGYVGLPSGDLVAIDLRTGTVTWRASIGGRVTRAPGVADGLAFVGGEGGRVATVDVETGTVRWRGALGEGQVSTPGIRDGVVYVASGLDRTDVPHAFHALAAADGHELWRFTPPSGKALSVGAVGPGHVYAVSLDGSVYALRTDGTVAWAQDIGSPIGSVATLSHGILYVSASDGTIAALDEATGDVIWTTSVRGDPGPALVSDGELYVGTALGRLLALGLGTPR